MVEALWVAWKLLGSSGVSSGSGVEVVEWSGEWGEVVLQLAGKPDPHHFNAESILIESLLNHDPSIISSSKIDSLLDEFAGELILLKSIPPGIDETDCNLEEEIRLIEKLLYDNSSPRPSKEFIFENSEAAIESFSTIPVEDSDSFMKEIDLSFTPDDPMPSGIEEDDYDSERDILIESNEFIKSSVENLVPNPSEYEDLSDSECDVPACDKFTTFLNLLFDVDDDSPLVTTSHFLMKTFQRKSIRTLCLMKKSFL
nr:hypothetical protein [Tanacetum cinerariifolium]